MSSLNNIEQTDLIQESLNAFSVSQEVSYGLELTQLSNNNSNLIYNENLLFDESYLHSEADNIIETRKDLTGDDTLREQIVFIDSAVEDYRVLVDSLTAATKAIVLDAERDGILQIQETLSQYEALDEVHIVSHGAAGKLYLGNTELSQDNLADYADVLESWGDSLDVNGDIVLYGCNVAEAGSEFVSELSDYTNADILASNDLTGNSQLGGDWDLEVAVGEVEAEVIFTTAIQNSYQNTLFSYSFSPISTSLGTFDHGTLDFEAVSSNNYEIFGSDTISLSAFSPSTIDVYQLDLNKVDLDPINSNLNTFLNSFDSKEFSVTRYYQFGDPIQNTGILNFNPNLINFDPFNFNFESVSINASTIKFDFNPETFKFSPHPNFTDNLKFAFDPVNFNLYQSIFEFDADSVTFTDSSIVFEYNNLSYDSSLFQANAELFSYKFTNSKVDFTNPNIFSASDFRALEYAFKDDRLFDGEYYLDNNFDISAAKINPFTHFTEFGWREGRDPNLLFDTEYYLANNIDIRNAGVNPLKHYIERGGLDTLARNPHPLFDTFHYLDNNLDVVDAGMNGLVHFTFHGGKEITFNQNSRDPNRYFDTSYYLLNNPDVAKDGSMTGLEHYMLYGWQESIPDSENFKDGRDPNAFFDSSFYYETHNDVLVAAAGSLPVLPSSPSYSSANPVQQFIEFSQIDDIERITHPTFEGGSTAGFSTFINSQSEGFSFAKSELSKYNIDLFPRSDGKISITQNKSELKDPIEYIVDGILYSIYATGVYLATEFPEDVGEAFKFAVDTAKAAADPTTYENIRVTFSVVPEDLFASPPAFPLPQKGQIQVESFPKDINEILDIIENGNFVTPLEPAVEFPKTTFPQRDEILERLLNGSFIFPEEISRELYVLTIQGEGTSVPITVIGTPDTPEELPQGISLGQLEGGGTIRFLGNKSQGIEGYFTPTGETKAKPFSLKASNTVGRKANLITIINQNGRSIQNAGITDPALLRIEVKQFGAEEIKNFVDNGPIKNIPLEGIFEKIYFDAADGTVEVNSTGTYLR